MGPAAYTRPRENEIAVRNRAVAVNPNNWLMQSIGGLIYPWLEYPFILGTDTAGEVVEVGSGVSRFKVGHRVVGNAVGCDKSRNIAAEGAFQTFTVPLEHMTTPIPQSMAFENAVVVPWAYRRPSADYFKKIIWHFTIVGEAHRKNASGMGWAEQRRQQRHPAGRGGRL